VERVFAHIEHGVVVNISVWGSDPPAELGLVEVTGTEFGIGDLYDGQQFSKAPVEPSVPPVPQSVTRAQGKAVLIQMGLWQQVLDFVAAIPDATRRAVAEVALHDTQNWERSSPFLNQAAQALGMTDEQLDDLFRAAAQVRL